MEKRQHEDRTVTLLCLGLSGIALVLGMWIAASLLGAGPQYRAAGTIVLAGVVAEARR